MPTYDFVCLACRKEEEVFMKIADYQPPSCCGASMKQRIGGYGIIGDLEPYMDPNIGEVPVFVKSKKHRKQLMKEHGIQEKFGKGWS